MIHIPSARPTSGIPGFMLVLPLLLLTSCGSTPQHQPRPQQTPAAVVDSTPIELAAGVAPVFADEEEAGVRPATDGSSGTKLLQLHPTDSVAAVPTEEVVVRIPTSEQLEAVDQALARAADARQYPAPPIPAPDPIEEIETAEVETAEIEVAAIEVAEVVIEEAAADPIEPVEAARSTVERIPTTPSIHPTITETVATNGLERLTLMCGPGSLTILRDRSANQIVATAEVVCHASNPRRQQELSDGVRLAIDGPTAGLKRIRVIEPPLEAGEECRVHLNIRIPAADDSGFTLKIQDSSGDISVADFSGDLSITSLKGAIDVTGGVGSLIISSGHGPCSVTSFEGPIKIRDGAGDCSLGQISGDVEVWGRNGALEIRYITGNVTAIDGRDGILVQSVEGNLTLYGIPLTDSSIEGVSGSVMSKTGAP
ncbi:MAG TPA: hypothetical protein EYQ08_04730 [Planctomycetes bacterium]|nr:hypothetical protein [Planctomycetota bacterium]HIK81371.1 hypothetical protein [Planctomycetota bacterium]